MSLIKLYEKISQFDFVKYNTQIVVPSPLDNINLLDTSSQNIIAKERVFIKGLTEETTITYFNPKLTTIGYGGRDHSNLKKTLDDLRLPSNFHNSLDLGEMVFYQFRSQIKKTELQDEPYFELGIIPGKEEKMERILNRLCNIYAAALTKTQSAGVSPLIVLLYGPLLLMCSAIL